MGWESSSTNDQNAGRIVYVDTCITSDKTNWGKVSEGKECD